MTNGIDDNIIVVDSKAFEGRDDDAGIVPAHHESIYTNKESSWEFNEHVTPVFDEHVRQNVPQYDEIHSMITNMSSWFVEKNTNIYDIGTSTGEVINNLQSKTDDSVSIIGIDTSETMVEKARIRFEKCKNVSIVCEDILNNKFKLSNSSYTVSMLTMQFISPQDRQEVINKIYEGLNRGGAFILVEKIVGSNARFNDIWTNIYHDMKLSNGLTETEVYNKSRAIRGVLKPFTIEENIEILDNAGFKDVEVFFKWGNFAGFLAIK